MFIEPSCFHRRGIAGCLRVRSDVFAGGHGPGRPQDHLRRNCRATRTATREMGHAGRRDHRNEEHAGRHVHRGAPEACGPAGQGRARPTIRKAGSSSSRRIPGCGRLPAGKAISLVGEVSGQEVRPLGGIHYRYPVSQRRCSCGNRGRPAVLLWRRHRRFHRF